MSAKIYKKYMEKAEVISKLQTAIIQAFLFIFEAYAHYVVHASLKLQASGNPPTSASR
jgi:hypothetical protein